MLEIKELEGNERVLINREAAQIMGGEIDPIDGGTTSFVKDGTYHLDSDVPGGTEYTYAPNDHHETTYILIVVPWDSPTVPNV